MDCSYYDAGRCRSCTLLDVPYGTQLADKDRLARELLAPFGDPEWLPPVASSPSGYRNKAKMVVGGTVDAPTIGILDEAGRGVDLRECGICAAGVRAALPVLARFVTRTRLVPYDVPARRGELKYVLVTASPDDELMIRFVLRDESAVARIRRGLPGLLRELPNARVVSANLQPDHKAVVEGDREIVLTPDASLVMRLGDVSLRLRPQSFFQTNTAVAERLYAQVAEWVDAVSPASVWDLYCGVGGFALHVAAPGRRVVGVETSKEAVRSARATAAAAGLPQVAFRAQDATAFALGAAAAPELVIVNPPRRGIGADLTGWLERSGARHVVYSSCNPASLAKDLAGMPSYTLRAGRVLDMFPQTGHMEVAVLLERVGAAQ
ncbi:23S rRNA (uracil(747)-C(5))-methyltransferase RlmC [Leifsonia sp. F6_8S_P_1B]|uniref:23S rRNA (Uracil(747)-C(5))-methyltransferase RlmC n=1 Tax=Leifsonia williamsii TaxID=3035919 RepID=A0ABT8KB47_9MICO|nr:23S rRNA (uracil(747)-C(5))-methyltransferase RlmC [Leifsonia williamsii]MDN4614678.1 23S rRNA (uracil(747)-C(5))-methyltransferase RlmC [Leifsonia williamsii]